MEKQILKRLAIVACISAIIVAYVLYKEKQPVAQTISDSLAQAKKVKMRSTLAPPIDPVPLIASTDPTIDSITAKKKKQAQDAADKRTVGNLYMQKLLARTLDHGIDNQAINAAKLDKALNAIDSLTKLVNEKPKVIYLTPIVNQVDTFWKGIQPIPQSKDRDKKAQDKVKKGIMEYFREVYQLQGRSYDTLGYRQS